MSPQDGNEVSNANFPWTHHLLIVYLESVSFHLLNVPQHTSCSPGFGSLCPEEGKTCHLLLSNVTGKCCIYQKLIIAGKNCVLGKRHNRVLLSYPVLWRYKIEEHNLPAFKEHMILQEDKTLVNEKKTHLLREHKRAVQVVRAEVFRWGKPWKTSWRR